MKLQEERSAAELEQQVHDIGQTLFNLSVAMRRQNQNMEHFNFFRELHIKRFPKIMNEPWRLNFSLGWWIMRNAPRGYTIAIDTAF